MDRKDFFKYVGAASLIAGLGGCKDFLDVVPNERATLEDAFGSKDAAKDYLYSCYSPMPNPREVADSIDFFTADEVTTSFEHETFSHFPEGQYSASNPVISYWGNLYQGIRLCYMLITNVDKTPQMSAVLKKQYKAEAKFLIGYYNYLLIRMYGPIIVQKGVVDVNTPTKDFKPRSTLEESISFTVDILDEAAKSLPNRRTGSQYGRATKVAAKAIKSRLLLYRASPLFNGGGEDKDSFYTGFTDKDSQQLIPTEYEVGKWADAADAARAAINVAEAAGHSLYRNESSFSAALPTDSTERNLRFTIIDQDSKEILWADTRPEGNYMLQNDSEPFGSHSWDGVSPILTMLESFYTENGLPIDKDPDFDYKDRYSVVNGPNGKTWSLNLHREPRFNAWVCYHNSYYEVNDNRRTSKKVLCKFRKHDNQGMHNRTSNFPPNGYLNKKGVSPLSVVNTWILDDYPWPIIRLAGLYLDYAEALIEYGQDFGTAKTYIDKVRNRAGIPSIDEAWAPIGGADDKETLRSIVRQERRIELYLENERFWDLRRWMAADEPLSKKAQGCNPYGITNKDFFQLYTVPYPRRFTSPTNYLMPIPIGEINKNINLVQNPGY